MVVPHQVSRSPSGSGETSMRYSHQAFSRSALPEAVAASPIERAVIRKRCFRDTAFRKPRPRAAYSVAIAGHERRATVRRPIAARRPDLLEPAQGAAKAARRCRWTTRARFQGAGVARLVRSPSGTGIGCVREIAHQVTLPGGCDRPSVLVLDSDFAQVELLARRDGELFQQLSLPSRLHRAGRWLRGSRPQT